MRDSGESDAASASGAENGPGWSGGAPPWSVLVRTDGLEVIVPETFSAWGEVRREGYLAQRVVYAAEGRIVAFAYSCVRRARAGGGTSDPWEVAATTLGGAMSMTFGRASALVSAAVELIERLPCVAALLRGGWIGMEAVRAIVEQTRMVSDELIGELDRQLAAELGPTRRRAHAPKIGPLRRLLGRMILRADPVGAEANAREAREDSDVHLEPIGGDRAALSAIVPAEIGLEIMERIEQLVRRAGDGDTRTLPQKRAAGLLALARGWDRLPAPDGSLPGDPSALAAARQVVLYAFEAPDGVTDLRGHGPVTGATVEDLESTVRRRHVRVADLASGESAGAVRYSPSEALRLFCQGRDGTCVFPGCGVDAERCDLDHIVPFDHVDPARGGHTTSDDLADLCRGHHRLKTDGIWAYHRDADGGYVWMHGPQHPDRDPDLRIRVEAAGPLAGLGAPVDPDTVERQRTAAEEGRTGCGAENSGGGGRARPHRQERLLGERRRRRARVEEERARRRDDLERARPAETGGEDAPPF